MTRRVLFAAVLCALPASFACSDSGGDGPDEPGSGDGGAAVEGDAGDAPEVMVGAPRETPDSSAFEELIAYDWEIQPGEEKYYCKYQTVTEELQISDFMPIQPEGTHHVTIGFVEEGPEDGVVVAGGEEAEFPCDGLTLGDELIYAAVLHSPGFTLPQGVATKVEVGKKLLLSVHVFNGTDDVLSGRTGIAVVKADPKQIEERAEVIFALNPAIVVEPGETSFVSTCTMEGDGTILGLQHHMHLTGVHQKTTLVRGNGEREVLYDAPYDFYDQGTLVLDPPVQVEEGDTIEVVCDYDNPTSETLVFGESTGNSEMCLTAITRYPAVASNFRCAK